MGEMLKGKFRAKPIAWTIGLSKNGHDQAEVTFELLDEPHVGVKKTWFGSFNGGAMKHTIKALQNCGFEGVDIGLLDHMPPTAEEVVLVFEPDNYNGKTTEKIAWVNKPGGVSTKPMEASAKDAFRERMRGEIAGLDSSQVSKTPDLPSKPPDDLPF